MGFKDILATRNRLSVALFIVICLYVPCSVAFLLLVFGILPKVPGIYHSLYTLIIFSMASFVLTIIISTYHLGLHLRRKKRSTDRV